MLKPPVDLISDASLGDAKAAETLVELVWPEAYRIALSVLGKHAAAEDAAQEACARVLISMHTLKYPERFSIWFYRIVANEAITQFRKTRREDPAAVESADGGGSDVNEERVDVRRAIDTLPGYLRATIVLFYYADLTTSEIAEVMGTTPVAVRLRLMLARRRLRPLLSVVPIEPKLRARKGEVCSHEPESAG
jgi:RNA polymerase sigma-70 factor (ECF subfamily)